MYTLPNGIGSCGYIIAVFCIRKVITIWICAALGQLDTYSRTDIVVFVLQGEVAFASVKTCGHTTHANGLRLLHLLSEHIDNLWMKGPNNFAESLRNLRDYQILKG